MADLLSNELNRKVILVQNDKAYDFKAFKEVSYDTLYTRMMVNSDNFMAEQLMLRVGSVTEGKYSVAQAIKYSLEYYISDIPQKPRWVDGSGLSRYNMFSPKSISFLLKKMYDEIRNLVPIFTEDVIMYPYVNKVKDYIINNKA